MIHLRLTTKDSKIRRNLCRLPSAVNVMLKLSAEEMFTSLAIMFALYSHAIETQDVFISCQAEEGNTTYIVDQNVSHKKNKKGVSIVIINFNISGCKC